MRIIMLKNSQRVINDILSAIFISIMALILLTSHAHAWGLKDLGEEFSVPITTDAKDVVIYGSGATLAVLLFEDQVEDPVQEEAVRAKPFGKSAAIGDWIGLGFPNLIYVAGQSVAGYYGNEKGYRRSLDMLKASLYSYSVTQVLKVTVREQRPSNKDQRDSFPSAHATLAFAFGGYVFEEHGWEWGVPALAAALFSGLSRINDDRHYLHDVMFGATIGMAYGVGMSKYSKKKEKMAYMLVPIIDSKTKGLALVKDF
jgi:hypothetical protein